MFRNIARSTATFSHVTALRAQGAVSLLSLGAGLWWIVWGVVCLVRGPWLRRTSLVMAWVTAGLAAASAVVQAYVLLEFEVLASLEYGSPGVMLSTRTNGIFNILLRLFYPAMLLLLLSRRQVRHLFKHGSEAGEA
jgi:hypothetical protein